MNYNLCRCEHGYLVSAECVQTSPGARRAHRYAERLGMMVGAELSPGLAARMTYNVAMDGYAFVSHTDAACAELDVVAGRLAPLVAQNAASSAP